MNTRQDLIDTLFKKIKNNPSTNDLPKIKNLIEDITQFQEKLDKEMSDKDKVNLFNSLDENGETLLSIVCDRYSWYKDDDYNNIIKWLLDAKASPNIPTHSNKTPLYHAVSDKNITVAQWLLDAKASLENQDAKLLNAVARDGNVDLNNVDLKMAKLLLSHQASPNGYDDFQENALCIAVKNKNPELVSLLLEAKADPNNKTIREYVGIVISKPRDTSILEYAFRDDQIAILKSLLAAKASPDTIFKGQWDEPTTLLYEALMRKKNNEAVRVLLEAKASPDIIGPKHYFTNLQLALHDNNIEALRLLLEHKASADLLRPNDIYTPLQLACQRMQTDAVKLLLEHNASPNLEYKAKDEAEKEYTGTALDIAIMTQRIHLVILNLQHGAKIRHTQFLYDYLISCEQSNPDVITAWTYFCNPGNHINPDKDVVLSFIKKADDFLSLQNKDKSLISALKDGIKSVLQPKYNPKFRFSKSDLTCVSPRAMRLILDEKVETPLTTSKEITAELFRLIKTYPHRMTLADMQKIRNGIQQLAEMQTNAENKMSDTDSINLLDTLNEKGESLLSNACGLHKDGTRIIVQWLLEAKASPNVPIQKDLTPLRRAIPCDDTTVVQWLLDAKASLASQETELMTIAVECNKLNLIKLLLNHVSPDKFQNHLDSAFCTAVKWGRLEIVNLLVEAKANATDKTIHDYENVDRGNFIERVEKDTPLVEYAYCRDFCDNKLPMLKSLFDAKASPDIIISDRWGKTSLLHDVVERGNTELTRVLLESKASPDFVTSEMNRFTPLQAACRDGETEIVKLLLEHKASPNLENTFKPFSTAKGTTRNSLDFAVESKNIQVILLNLEHGAKIRQPQVLFNYLVSCKQNEPDVELAWKYFINPNNHVNKNSPLISQARENLQKVSAPSFKM